MSKIKKFGIDTNFNYLGGSKPIISWFEINYFDLKEGDVVIGYQDDQEWEGVIKYDNTCPEEMEWYLDIDENKEYSVSLERMEGRREGERSAIPVGEIRGEIYVVTAMIKDGIEIDTVKKFTRLSRSRLENIKRTMERKINH